MTDLHVDLVRPAEIKYPSDDVYRKIKTKILKRLSGSGWNKSRLLKQLIKDFGCSAEQVGSVILDLLADGVIYASRSERRWMIYLQ